MKKSTNCQIVFIWACYYAARLEPDLALAWLRFFIQSAKSGILGSTKKRQRWCITWCMVRNLHHVWYIIDLNVKKTQKNPFGYFLNVVQKKTSKSDKNYAAFSPDNGSSGCWLLFLLFCFLSSSSSFFIRTKSSFISCNSFSVAIA